MSQPGAVQQRFHHLAAEAAALQVAGHHDVPEHSAVDAVAAGPPKAHQPLAAPQAHHHGAAAQHLAQIVGGALPSPEGVLPKQPLQLQQAAGRPAARPHPQEAEAWGTRGMTNQTDPHGGIQGNNRFCQAGLRGSRSGFCWAGSDRSGRVRFVELHHGHVEGINHWLEEFLIIPPFLC